MVESKKNALSTSTGYTCWEQVGQGAFIEYLQGCDAQERRALLAQLNVLQPQSIKACLDAKQPLKQPLQYLPAPYIPVPEHGGDSHLWSRAKDQGESLLRSGQVAVMTLAGGLGTRLGLSEPKGLLELNTPQGRQSLFELFAHKLLQAQATYRQQPIWILLTSPTTHASTQAYFKKKRFFGLDPNKIHFITQKQLPLLSPQGDLLLKTRASLYQSPDGHGGALGALHTSEILERLKREHVKHLSVFHVDNPLASFLEPAALGLHEAAQAQMSCRVLLKEHPQERLGLFCQDPSRRPYVIEYHAVPEPIQEQRTPKGSLRLCVGNPGLYLLSLDFLQKTPQQLPLHRIHVRIPALDINNIQASPKEVEAIKFERYLFDLLKCADHALLIEARRACSFAPIKEPSGLYSPQSAEVALFRAKGGVYAQ